MLSTYEQEGMSRKSKANGMTTKMKAITSGRNVACRNPLVTPNVERPQHNNNKIINRQITRVAELGDLKNLLEAVHGYLFEMNGINLATAIHRVAKLACIGHSENEMGRIKKHPIFQELFQKIVEHISNHSLLRTSENGSLGIAKLGEMPVQCMSIVTWSCATLQIRHKLLFTAIADIAAPRLTELKTYELSNLLWAYAKLSFSPCDLFQNVMVRLLRRHEGEFKVQCLSTIAWSFATVKRRNLALFNSLAKELAVHAQEMKPQEISNTLWAFAKSHCANAELFKSLGDAAVHESKIYNFKPQELSNTCWAFATVGLLHQALFTKVEALSITKRYEMVPQNIANIVWSYAKLQIQPRTKLIPLLLEVSAAKLSQYKLQEFSAVVWAAAQMCPQNTEFFQVAAQWCRNWIPEFPPNGLANLAKAFSVVQMDLSNLFVVLLQECLPRLPQFKSLAVCNLLRGIVGATSNPQMISHKAQIEDAVVDICDHVALRIHDFKLPELHEMSNTLRMSKSNQSNSSIDNLEQAIAELKLQRQEHPQELVVAGCKTPRSMGSVSTSAEESQVEDEDEEMCWPTTEDSYNNNGLEDAAFEFKSGQKSTLGSKGHMPMQIHLASAKPVAKYSKSPLQVAATMPMPVQQPDDTPWRVPLPASMFGPVEMEGLHIKKNDKIASVGVDMAASNACAPMLVSSNTCGVMKCAMPGRPKKQISNSSKTSLDSPLGSCPVASVANGTPLTRLQTFDVSCLTELSPEGTLNAIDVTTLAHTNVIGAGEEIVYLRHGRLDERVVVKGTSSATGFAISGVPVCHPNILQPLAQITQGTEFPTTHLVSYPHCKNGNLSEWLAERTANGLPIKPAEAARIAQGILLGANALLCRGPIAIMSVQPDEIFMDAQETPRLREPCPNKPGGWQDALKWLSPDEITGELQAGSPTWPALSFRLGLLLYCMNTSETADPYPDKTGEEVLMGMLSEFRGCGPPFRPNMASYKGPEILRRLVAACFRFGGQAPPAQSVMVAVLETVASSKAP